MISIAWEYLRRNGQLGQQQLLNELGVKRSAFVFALLAQFRDVTLISTGPAVLVYDPG
jgi:hypothetical protein